MNWQEKEQLTQATLDSIKASMEKAITTSTGLQGYSLEKPALEIYPVLSPLRNRLPRTKGEGGNATNWKQITGVNAATKPTVAEGLRNGEISYTTADKTAPFKTWGRDDSVTFEANSQGRNFDDVKALSKASVMRRNMIDEEDIIVGGNTTLALGVAAAPTLAAAGAGATLPALTYSVIVVPLTYFGYGYAAKAGILALPLFLGANGGKSAAATQAVTLGQTLSASVTPVNGAVAYAWFTGAAGSEKLEKITTINSVTFSAPLTATGQLATAITAGDNSVDPKDFDGMITQLLTTGSGAYVKVFATGTPGTGTALTYDGAGGIVEIDDMFQSLWDTARISPDVLVMNSQQARDISKKIMTASSGSYSIQIQNGADGQQNVTGGVAVTSYVNKSTRKVVQIEVHPTLPSGTILALTNELPDWYPGNRPAGAWEMHMLDDYYSVEYAQVARKLEHGVYARGVLRGFLPTCQGILTNIAPG